MQNVMNSIFSCSSGTDPLLSQSNSSPPELCLSKQHTSAVFRLVSLKSTETGEGSVDFILVTSVSPFLVALAHRGAAKNHIMLKETKKGIKLLGGHRDMIFTLELATSG